MAFGVFWEDFWLPPKNARMSFPACWLGFAVFCEGAMVGEDARSHRDKRVSSRFGHALSLQVAQCSVSTHPLNNSHSARKPLTSNFFPLSPSTGARMCTKWKIDLFNSDQDSDGTAINDVLSG